MGLQVVMGAVGVWRITEGVRVWQSQMGNTWSGESTGDSMGVDL